MVIVVIIIKPCFHLECFIRLEGCSRELEGQFTNLLFIFYERFPWAKGIRLFLLLWWGTTTDIWLRYGSGQGNISIFKIMCSINPAQTYMHSLTYIHCNGKDSKISLVFIAAASLFKSFNKLARWEEYVGRIETIQEINYQSDEIAPRVSKVRFCWRGEGSRSRVAAPIVRSAM